MKFPKEIIIRFEADAKGTTVTAMDGGELIRCEDCKYYVDREWLKCPMLDPTAKDDYCSRAERKEE